MLWINPQLAAGVLTFSPRLRPEATSAFRDAQPGKIMHETRAGDGRAGRGSFGCYYGGVDTTPLFVMLAAAYDERAPAIARSVDRIWTRLLAATDWIERRLDSSPRFLDYARGEQSGLVNQAWKTVHDSMFTRTGAFRAAARRPQVQGYAYAALEAMSNWLRRA